MKLRKLYVDVPEAAVAPLAGAWIEIASVVFHSFFNVSLPSRERGLKSDDIAKGEKVPASLPSRERGLKYTSQTG